MKYNIYLFHQSKINIAFFESRTSMATISYMNILCIVKYNEDYSLSTFLYQLPSGAITQPEPLLSNFCNI